MTSMLDGVIDSLRHSNHDVSIDVIVEMELIPRIINETFNHPDVLGQRGYFNPNRIHRSLLLVAEALEILIDLILVVGIELWRDGFEQFYFFFL